jgi:hypothetical protein
MLELFDRQTDAEPLGAGAVLLRGFCPGHKGRI